MEHRQAVALGVGSVLAALGGLADATLVTLDWMVAKPVLDEQGWFLPAVAISTVILVAGLYLTLAPVFGLPLWVRGGDAERARERLGPGLRVFVVVGQELAGIASRLTHDPGMEVQFAPGQLVKLRDRLMTLVEPELQRLRKQFLDQIITLMQWVTLRKGALAGSIAGKPVNPKLYERLDKYEDSEPNRIDALLDKARQWIGKLER